MTGSGSLYWKDPRRAQCYDCKAVFETRAPNARYCPTCRKKRAVAKYKRYNLKRSLPEIREGDPIRCERCRYFQKCKLLVKTQAPLYCQVEDRRKLKRSAVAKLAEIPAAYRMER